MLNKKNTILFISLFIMVTLLLGVFFRKMDFKYLSDKYEAKSEQEESNSSQQSESVSNYSYSASFDATDFKDIYLFDKSISNDGITISSGQTSSNINGSDDTNAPRQATSSLLLKHDSSWKSIENVTMDVLLPISNSFVANQDSMLQDESIYLSWTINVNVDEQELLTTTTFDKGYINIFDNGSKTLDYVAPLREVFVTLAPNLGQERLASLKDSSNDFTISSSNSYFMRGFEVAPSFDSKGSNQEPRPLYVYFASVNGTKDTFNENGLLFTHQLTRYINEQINASPTINSASNVATIETLASQALNLELEIYNAYDLPIQDDLILYEEVNAGLDKEGVDLKVLLSTKYESYYLPLTLSTSAFYVGSPREFECCTPISEAADHGGTKYEKHDASVQASQMLTSWLNNPAIGDVRSFNYLMYYGSKYQLVAPLFDEEYYGETTCTAGLGCNNWVRYETLPMLATPDNIVGEWPGDEHTKTTTYTDNSIDGIGGACNTWNTSLLPGGYRWIEQVPSNYPIYPVAGTNSGDLMFGEGGDDEWDPAIEPNYGVQNSKLSKFELLNKLSSLNQKATTSKLKVSPDCKAETFIPIVNTDSNAYPNAGAVNGNDTFSCFTFYQCQQLVFKPTPENITSQVVISYPDIDQVSDTFTLTLDYTYNQVHNTASYSNGEVAKNEVSYQISELVGLGEIEENDEYIRPGDTYQVIEDVIWKNIAIYGWGNFESRVNKENMEIVFYADPLGEVQIPTTTPLKYGDDKLNQIYYSFETKNPDIVTFPGTIETIVPFYIKDTSLVDFSPTQSEIASGSSCVSSLINSKFEFWNASTTIGTIKQEINNDQSVHCISKFGLNEIESSLELVLYKDHAGQSEYSDDELIGEVSVSKPKVVYYRYELIAPLDWYESYDMPMQSFSIMPQTESIYLNNGYDLVIGQDIENRLTAIANDSGSLTYGQVMEVVEQEAQRLVIPVAANSIGINYYNSNELVQTELDPNDHMHDDSEFYFDIYQTVPILGYTYFGEMNKLNIRVRWDSSYTVYADTKGAASVIENSIETETIIDENGNVMQVGSNQIEYDDIEFAINKAFGTIFKPQDFKYIDKSSLVIRDSGTIYNGEMNLKTGTHYIEYNYDQNNNNCSWFDDDYQCHVVDNVSLVGFDGISNTFEIEIREVISVDLTIVQVANTLIASLIANEIDKNGDGKVDKETSATYFRIVDIIKETLIEQKAFKANSTGYKVEVRAVFNNSIGRPEYFIVDESNIGNIVDSGVTGFQYHIVSSNSKSLSFNDASGYEYYTTWTGQGYQPPVQAGTIYGNGVMYGLIVGSFAVLIIGGITTGSVLLKRRNASKQS